MAFCGWHPLSAAAAGFLRLPLLPCRHADFSVQAAPQRRTAARTGHKPATLGWVAFPRIASTEGIRRHSLRSVICASLFGVGAPEALVIGVVALLVFGPKGLAEVARNLGKTLRAFQPTIRELQDVSREFRSTLEREIGIDEVPPSTNYRPPTTNYSQPPAVDPNVKPETAPYTSEELMKVTEEQLAASAAAAWSPQPAAPSQQQESEATSTSQTNDATPSGGNDGPPPPAAATEPDSSQANQPKKADTRDESANSLKLD